MDAKQVLAMIKEQDVKYVDFRFTDPRGKWQHTARMALGHRRGLLHRRRDVRRLLDRRLEGDQRVRHDPDAGSRRPPCSIPFAAQTTLIVFCDVVEPSTGQPYARDPRSTAKRAEAYMKSSGIGDTAVFGPELEFFVFDDVRYDVQMNGSFYKIDIERRRRANTGDRVRRRQHGPSPGRQGRLLPGAAGRIDERPARRDDVGLTEMGLTIEKHHHEVAPAQNELGFRFDTLVKTADNVQMYKYALHNVAHSYGKTATFMPKPIYGDNGSGMHTHQSIWKDDKPLFAGNGYADLSETALYYIGGIIKHAKALNAFTNPATNSYKRLIPGFEAPVLLAYSARNRSASCRIPYVASPKGKRVEVRFPDPSANPYLAFAAMLMAGLDGIQNKIHPGDPMDKNLYDLPPEELRRSRPCAARCARR